MQSNFYNDYKRARDLSWKILIEQNVSSLPVNISKICRNYNIKLNSFSTAKEKIKNFDNLYTKGMDGFSINVDGKYFLFFNNDTYMQRTRFTIAHELGHIILGDIKDGGMVTRWNKCEEQPPDAKESAANIFASRLLAPACVLHEMHVSTVDEIVEVTGLSHTAAEIRLERLNELNRRKKFYLSPLERQVLNQFKDFIQKYK